MSNFVMKTYHYACNDCGAPETATVIEGTFDYEDTSWVCAECIKIHEAVFQWELENGFTEDEDGDDRA